VKLAAILATLAALAGSCSAWASRTAGQFNQTCPTYLPNDSDVHGTMRAVPMQSGCPTTTTGHG
jgi:hypothetical protein